MITPHDMTVYNRYIDGGIEKYKRSVVYGVKWENRKAANVVKSGLLAADSVVVYVPFQRGENYVTPKFWSALEDKGQKWTLKDGDYLVKGVVVNEITSSFTISMLKAMYDNVVQIRSVDTMDAGSASLHHWQVGAG